MEYVEIPGVGKPVAHLVLGTMVITDEEEAREKGPWGNLNREGAFALLDVAMALGGATPTTRSTSTASAGPARPTWALQGVLSCFIWEQSERLTPFTPNLDTFWTAFRKRDTKSGRWDNC